MGMFSLPYAMRIAGIVPALAMIIGYGIISAYTAQLLVDCMKMKPGINSYSGKGAEHGSDEIQSPNKNCEFLVFSFRLGRDLEFRVDIFFIDIGAAAYGRVGRVFLAVVFFFEVRE